MKTRIALFVCLCLFSLTFTACKKDKDEPETPYLVFRFVFDSNQERLNNIGEPTAVPSGHGAQSPRFNTMSAHYIEMAPGPYTQIGQGTVIYHNAETYAGGDKAIDFSQSHPVGNGEVFYKIPIKDVTPGTYQWLRVSLAYQNYDIDYRYTYAGTDYDLSGTLASFIGYNTYVTSFKIKDSIVAVNQNRLQGYWAFESAGAVAQGQAPPGATTVPNPLFDTSPIPAGSCLVTGPFQTPFEITGNEKADKVITVSLSTNKSFEWVEHSTPGYFEPAAGDTVVDMGVRGMRVYY